MNETEDIIDLKEVVANGVRFVQNHYRLFLIWILIGLTLGTTVFILLPKVYESKMVITSDILTKAHVKEMNETLTHLIDEGNTPELALRLALSEEEVSAIKAINIKNLNPDKGEPQAKSNLFSVLVYTYNKEILPKLQKGVTQYFNNNEFVKIRVRQRKEMYQQLINKIATEINSLDSLKRRLLNGSAASSKNEMLLVDPSKIYSEIINLHKERLTYKNNLELAESVQVVEGFTVYNEPTKPVLFTWLALGLGGGIFTASGLLLLMYLMKVAKTNKA
ncbi:MAG: hypothetical protein JSS93_11750 [Bacteroidetes bacterium]|nr:hypothetical protein [Bacteroidota bacterium]